MWNWAAQLHAGQGVCEHTRRLWVCGGRVPALQKRHLRQDLDTVSMVSLPCTWCFHRSSNGTVMGWPWSDDGMEEVGSTECTEQSVVAKSLSIWEVCGRQRMTHCFKAIILFLRSKIVCLHGTGRVVPIFHPRRHQIGPLSFFGVVFLQLTEKIKIFSLLPCVVNERT